MSNWRCNFEVKRPKAKISRPKKRSDTKCTVIVEWMGNYSHEISTLQHKPSLQLITVRYTRYNQL